MPEEVPALLWREEIADLADRVDEGVERSGTDPAQVRLELGIGLFDGVQVRTVGRQEQEPASSSAQRCCSLLVPVGAEIVEDHGRSGAERGRELGLDIGGERGAVHRALDYPGRDQAILREAGDEGLRAPFPERSGADQPLAHGRAPAQPGHGGLH